jgi:hypothetical protein
MCRNLLLHGGKYFDAHARVVNIAAKTALQRIDPTSPTRCCMSALACTRKLITELAKQGGLQKSTFCHRGKLLLADLYVVAAADDLSALIIVTNLVAYLLESFAACADILQQLGQFFAELGVLFRQVFDFKLEGIFAALVFWLGLGAFQNCCGLASFELGSQPIVELGAWLTKEAFGNAASGVRGSRRQKGA